jgi:C-terminal peptidase prc
LSTLPRLALAAIALAALTASPATAVDIKFERSRVKDILRVVSGDISKNFYDPKLKGLDWKAAVKEAEGKIDAAQSASEMLTAIFVLVDKLKDSHTMFIPPGRVEKPEFGFNALAVGEEIFVYEIVKGGAAEKAGLKRGDRIVGLNGFGVQRAIFSQMMLFFRALRPAPALELQVVRGGEPPKKLLVEARMKRASLIPQDLTDDFNFWKLIREAENEKEYFHHNMYDGGIGYLHLPSFSASTSFIHDLAGEVKGAKAMIVDLRGNPGGAVKALEEFSGHFVTKLEPMAISKERAKNDPIEIAPRSPHFGGPLYVLVDSDTGSAAELFARHFQRTGQAVVIGDKTSGRVNVSRTFSEAIGVDTVVPFAVQVTIGELQMPDGKNLEGVGVTPDKACLPTAADLRDEKDPCRKMALALAREKLGIKKDDADEDENPAPPPDKAPEAPAEAPEHETK